MSSAMHSRWDELNTAGRTLAARGDDAGAEAAYRAALTEAEQGDGGPSRLATSLEALAELKYRKEDRVAAEALFRCALALRDAAADRTDTAVLSTFDYLADLCEARGAHAEAESFLARALAAVDGPAADHSLLAERLNLLAQYHIERGNHAAAEPLLLRLLDVEQAIRAGATELAPTLTSLATVESALGRHDEAEHLLREALSVTGADALLRKLAEEVAAQGRALEAVVLAGQPVPPAAYVEVERPLTVQSEPAPALTELPATQLSGAELRAAEPPVAEPSDSVPPLPAPALDAPSLAEFPLAEFPFAELPPAEPQRAEQSWPPFEVPSPEPLAEEPPSVAETHASTVPAWWTSLMASTSPSDSVETSEAADAPSPVEADAPVEPVVSSAPGAGIAANGAAMADAPPPPVVTPTAEGARLFAAAAALALGTFEPPPPRVKASAPPAPPPTPQPTAKAPTTQAPAFAPLLAGLAAPPAAPATPAAAIAAAPPARQEPHVPTPVERLRETAPEPGRVPGASPVPAQLRSSPPEAARARNSSLVWGAEWSPPPAAPSVVHSFGQTGSTRRAVKPPRRVPTPLRIAAAAAIAAAALLAGRLFSSSRSVQTDMTAVIPGTDPEVVPDFFRSDSLSILMTSGGSVDRAGHRGAGQSKARGGTGESTPTSRSGGAKTKATEIGLPADGPPDASRPPVGGPAPKGQLPPP